jgi:ribulose bisphosphate carboxylase small subunit
MTLSIDNYNIFIKNDGKWKQIYPLKDHKGATILTQQAITHTEQGISISDIKHQIHYIEDGAYKVGIFNNEDVRFEALPFTKMLTGEE